MFKKCKFIVNQVNHHSVTPNLKVVISKTNKHLLLIRNPEDTLSSMIKLSDSVNQPMSQEAVTAIYIERLEYLKKMTNLIDPLNWVFICYDDLLNNSEENLKNLTNFLALKKPLKKEYQLKRKNDSVFTTSAIKAGGSIPGFHSFRDSCYIFSRIMPHFF